MTGLNQRDPRWGSMKLGTSNTYIKDYGCTITCLAMIIGTTPNVVNDKLNSVGGFANGNLVIWSKIPEAFPGIQIKRVWSYDNADVLANVPNVLVEVPAAPIGGSGSHWVVYLGNKRLLDPWTGMERPTSDFPNPTGYCVITGKWGGNQTIPVDEDVFKNLVSKSTKYDEFTSKGFMSADEVNKLIEQLRSDRESAQKSAEANWNLYQEQVEILLEKDSRIKSLEEQVGELSKERDEYIAANKTLNDKLSDLAEAIKKDAVLDADVHIKLLDAEQEKASLAKEAQEFFMALINLIYKKKAR